jgi:hypothetical protein
MKSKTLKEEFKAIESMKDWDAIKVRIKRYRILSNRGKEVKNIRPRMDQWCNNKGCHLEPSEDYCNYDIIQTDGRKRIGECLWENIGRMMTLELK